MPVISIPKATPKIHPSVYISEGAQVIGEVEIGEQSSVWFGSVIRGDVNFIKLGKRTNVQDLSVIHVTEQTPVVVGDDVTLGHRVTLHGCTIGNRALVGMGAIVMDRAVVQDSAFVAAGALMTPGSVAPSGMMMMGSPAKPKRALTDEEREWILKSSAYYVGYQEMYR
jgi:carbonic anhydrase/acetyltransferase-like protein (isoleucine patch superfamily)